MRKLLTATLVCCTIVGLAGAEEAQAVMRKATNIPAQELRPALQLLSKERDVQVVYRTDIVADLRTQGAAGELTVEEALRQLLSGTGLMFQYLDADTVTIVPLPLGPAAQNRSSSLGREDGASMDSSVRQEQNPDHAVSSLLKSFWRRLRLARAQDQQTPADAATAESENQDAELDEIVVTATKREERLLDAPQSVSVLSADALAKLGATQFRDFANTVPGLSFTTAGAGNNQITLRGVTTGFDVSPTTGTYVDEVPYGSSTVFANSAQLGLDPGLFGLDRIEVLRGPQGTLYGASSMGGLIKYVTKQPSTTGFGVEAQTGVSGTEDGSVSYNVNATINAPIVADKVALRASGFESHDGGYIDNFAQDRKDVNRSDVYGGRVDLLVAPAETVTIRIAAFLQNISRDGDATADYSSAGAQPFGSLGQSRPADEPFDQRFRVLSGTVTYDAGPATLTSISSYQTVRSEFVWDLSAIYVPFFAGCSFPFCPRAYGSVSVPVESETDKFTQEVRLASDAGKSLEWLIGGFYTRETSSLDESFALRDLSGQLAPNDMFTFLVPSRYQEYAAFGDLTWHFSEKFDATGGVRYAKNRQQFNQAGGGALGLSAPTNRATDDVLTYLANARYHFSDHATGYLRYATGYRPGGPAYVTLDPNTGLPNGPTTFEADRLKSYEAGFKVESADRRFGADLAGYYIDWSDMQVAFNNGGFTSIHNAPGGASIRGAELALTGRPSDALTIGSAFAYQDATLSEADSDLRAVKGEQLPNVPRFTGTLNADYELPMGKWQPTVGATLRYVDDRKSGFGSAYVLPDYTTVDLRTGIAMGAVNMQLYVHNLFDEHGQLSVAYPQFGGRVAILQPRTVGVSFTTQF